MNTFWGCETAKLTALSTTFGAGAARLHEVILAGARSARAATWSGPDAEEHRQHTEELVESAGAVVALLRERAQLLGEEAVAQDLCSQSDGSPGAASDPLGIRAVPNWHPSPGGGRAPRLGAIDLEDLRPLIGGPLAAEDPTRLSELLPDLPPLPLPSLPPLPALPDPSVLGPMIGGPLAAEDPTRGAVLQEDLPRDERFSLDPAFVAEARSERELGASGVPIVGTLQMAMDVHQKVDDAFDWTEEALEDNGYGELTPLVSLARTSNDLSGVAFGERSVLGQTALGVDHAIANVLQTGGEVSAALGDRDVTEAVGALERGLFRNAGATAEVLTATPVPAIADTAADLTGNAADLVEPFDAGTARSLREGEQVLGDLADGWEQGRRDLIDPERLYDLRRSALPAPWDPQA